MAKNATIKVQKSFLKTSLKIIQFFWFKLLLLFWNPREEFLIVGGIVSKFEEKYLPLNKVYNGLK